MPIFLSWHHHNNYERKECSRTSDERNCTKRHNAMHYIIIIHMRKQHKKYMPTLILLPKETNTITTTSQNNQLLKNEVEIWQYLVSIIGSKSKVQKISMRISRSKTLSVWRPLTVKNSSMALSFNLYKCQQNYQLSTLCLKTTLTLHTITSMHIDRFW